MIDLETRGCNDGCPYSERLVGQGEDAVFSPLGAHPAAEAECDARRADRVKLQQERARAARSQAALGSLKTSAGRRLRRSWGRLFR